MQAAEHLPKGVASVSTYLSWAAVLMLGSISISSILDYRAWIGFCNGAKLGWNNTQGYGLFRLQASYLILVGDKGSRDTSALRKYERKKARLSLFESRMGFRSARFAWLLPQRQAGPDNVPSNWRARIEETMVYVAEKFNEGQSKPIVCQGAFGLEGQSRALPMADSLMLVCCDSEVVHREVAHIHAQDASLHVLLAPTDAIEAIETGWQNDSQGPAGTV